LIFIQIDFDLIYSQFY